MSELIEKVAKAICNADWECDDHWRDCASELDKEHFRSVARATISAMQDLCPQAKRTKLKGAR